MNNDISSRQRLIFYTAWFLFAVIQASFTELQDDEAYYWVYSRFPDWGYFDHPPLTAILVKVGYGIFQNELGTRLLFILMNLGTLRLIENLIDPGYARIYYVSVVSLAVLQVAGFMAVPDIPLMFFAVLFFWLYRKLLVAKSIVYTVLLGIAMSALLYSKYHGILIILFTVISNPRLIINPRFVLAGILGLILFMPHLYWQYQHDFISFRYHLFESNVNDYRISFTTDYLAGQLLLAGPVAGFILLPAAFLSPNKTNDLFIRALKFTLAGFYLFFFITSFRGRVEANWTAPVMIPLLVLSVQFLAARPKWKQALYKTVPLSILIILLVRLAMIVDFLPIPVLKERFHSWQHWPAEMKRSTQGIPVVWNNSYQRASKYWYYTGQPTHSVNWYRERKNNFNYWPVEDSLLGNPVIQMDIYNTSAYPHTLNTPIGLVGFRYDSSFISLSKIHFDAQPPVYKAGTNKIIIVASPVMPALYRKVLHGLPPYYFKMTAGIFQNGSWIKDIWLDITPVQLASTKHLLINLPANLPPGEYYLRLALQTGQYPATHNSDKIKLVIE